VTGSPPNWRLIADAAQALTAAGQAPFTRASVYEWIWRRYPRVEHDRPSLDPTFQGMVGNAAGGPPSPCGTPLHHTGHGRYILVAPLPHGAGQSRRPAARAAGPAPPTGADPALGGLQHGPAFRFADWPNDQVPRRAAGVYTIWRADQLLYVGMSGRGAQAEDLVALPGHDGTDKAKWLWTRLDSHASGRRSGDQFNVYICDRFIVPALTPAQQHDIARGRLSLDHLTKTFIREHLSYRFVVYTSGAQALNAERDARAGGLPAGRPYLNPL
jgi:hypothetical protein